MLEIALGKKGLHRREILEIDNWGGEGILTAGDSGELENISWGGRATSIPGSSSWIDVTPELLRFSW